MPTLKLHYDGWLALPAGMRQKLGLNSGDRVEAELVGGALVLRPVMKARKAAPNDAATGASTVDVPEAHTPEPSAIPARRKLGRPRKLSAPAGEDGATFKKARGRPRKAAPTPGLGPAVLPVVAVGTPKLVKKADLQPKVVAIDPAPHVDYTVGRARGDTGSRYEERRPFCHVEVRKLGPGRGYNRPRRLYPGSAS